MREQAQYVSSGHMIYATAGALMAVPFDLERLETRGEALNVSPPGLSTIPIPYQWSNQFRRDVGLLDVAGGGKPAESRAGES